MLWSVLRLILYTVLGELSVGLGQPVAILGSGALFDVMTGLTVLMPLVLLASMFRMRWMNRIALDYLMYPDEGLRQHIRDLQRALLVGIA